MVALRSGSAAQRSDCLQVGDSISAINGTKVAKLNAADVHQMLRTNDRVQLDVEYQLPSPSSYAGESGAWPWPQGGVASSPSLFVSE